MTDTPSTAATKPDSEALIKAAVDYWAGFLKNGAIDTDREMGGMMAAMHMLARAQTRSVSPDAKVEKFREILTGKIREQIDRGSKWIEMTTDYGPEGILRDALNEAGTGANFRLKDSVSINLNGGTVTQQQIRGSSKTLFPPEPKKEVQGGATARLDGEQDQSNSRYS